MNEQPKKKKHSLWWIWLILILIAFTGGIVTGLKLNTLPLPNELRGRLYPILESYIPGSTKTRESEPAAETPAPEATAEPEETVQPEAKEEPETIEQAKPEETEAPTGTEAEKPIESLSPVETEPLAVPEESGLQMSETAAFAAEPTAVKYIGVNKALEIALKDADPGERKAEVSGVYRTKDDDGNPVYEVSFTIDEIGYDYVIDAVSGEIMSWKLSGLSFSETSAFGGAESEEPAELSK